MKRVLAVLAALSVTACGPSPASRADICAIFALRAAPGDSQVGRRVRPGLGEGAGAPAVPVRPDLPSRLAGDGTRPLVGPLPGAGRTGRASADQPGRRLRHDQGRAPQGRPPGQLRLLLL